MFCAIFFILYRRSEFAKTAFTTKGTKYTKNYNCFSKAPVFFTSRPSCSSWYSSLFC